MSHRLYKGKYFLVFYDKTDEYLEYMFDNVREILKFLKREPTRNNIVEISVVLYRALRSTEHFTTLFGKVNRVYIIDAEDDDEEEFAICE